MYDVNAKPVNLVWSDNQVIFMVSEAINKEDYERELAERQRQHLANVHGRNDANWRPCMHDQCTQCHGTGVRYDGSVCIHYLSCPCPKCTPSY